MTVFFWLYVRHRLAASAILSKPPGGQVRQQRRSRRAMFLPFFLFRLRCPRMRRLDAQFDAAALSAQLFPFPSPSSGFLAPSLPRPSSIEFGAGDSVQL